MAEKFLPGFERFWQSYGYKIGRATAYRAWVKNRCEEIADEIIAALPAYKAHLAANTWKAQMHASTFINQQRWEDEYEPPKPIIIRQAANYGRTEIVPKPQEKMSEEEQARRAEMARRARELVSGIARAVQ